MNMTELKEKFDNWDVEYENRNALEKMYDFVRWTIPRVLEEWSDEVRYAWQRVFRGYDNRYWWSHFSEHSVMTRDALQVFRDRHVGSPTLLYDDNHEQWNTILDKMIAGFQATIDICDVHVLDDAGKYDFEATRQEVTRLTAIQTEGLTLYTKHYNSLWD